MHTSCNNPTRLAQIPVDVEVADDDVPVDDSDVVEVPVLEEVPVLAVDESVFPDPVPVLLDPVTEDEEDPAVGSNVTLPVSDEDVVEDVEAPVVLLVEVLMLTLPVPDDEAEVLDGPVLVAPVLREVLEPEVVVVVLLVEDDLVLRDVLMFTLPVPDEEDSVELVVGEPLQSLLVLGSTRRSVIGWQSVSVPAPS